MRYDIFCRVVDNFGDAAVCWRLARQLAREHGHSVRLWLDQPDALNILCPERDRAAPRQMLDGVEVIHWFPGVNIDAPSDVVVEAFGCGLPETLPGAMTLQSPQSLWIVLEYLSAEPWVAQCHGLPSPHPSLPLQRFFFFPGFSPATGGLLREADLPTRRAAFNANPDACAALWRDLGFAPPEKAARTVSLFGYENANVDALLCACANGEQNIVVAVPPSPLRHQVCRFFGEGPRDDGATLRRGRLEARLIPFLAQPRYDELLWACDWNFVRGEDSFVRAQWACTPFVWQIYRQEEQAHRVKLDAFLGLYLEAMDPAAAAAWAGLWRSWNGSGQLLAEHWGGLQKHFASLRAHANRWQERLAEMPDLATNLANFCSERLKLLV